MVRVQARPALRITIATPTQERRESSEARGYLELYIVGDHTLVERSPRVGGLVETDTMYIVTPPPYLSLSSFDSAPGYEPREQRLPGGRQLWIRLGRRKTLLGGNTKADLEIGERQEGEKRGAPLEPRHQGVLRPQSAPLRHADSQDFGH